MKKILYLYFGLMANAFAQSQTLMPTTASNTVLAYGTQNPAFVGRFRGGTASSPSATPNGATLMQIGGIGYNGTTYPSSPAAHIAFKASQTFTSTAIGAGIHFYTTPNNSLFSLERLIIAHNGNVGIGTFTGTPLSKLHIRSGSSGITPATNIYPLPVVILEDDNNAYLSLLGGDSEGIKFGTTAGAERGKISYINSLDRMIFSTGGNDKMAIRTNGNVGINSTIPLAKLDVNGDFRLAIKRGVDNSQTWHNLDRSGASLIKVSGGGTVTITGLQGGTDGMIVKLFIASTTNLSILANNSNSSIGNRFAQGISINQGGGVTLIYDADAGFWRIVGYNP